MNARKIELLSIAKKAKNATHNQIDTFAAKIGSRIAIHRRLNLEVRREMVANLALREAAKL